MGKKSKSLQSETIVEGEITKEKTELTYEDKILNVNVIANPLAGKKLTKKLFKLIKKACKDKRHFFDGLKSVQLKLRKGEKGLVIFAGDVLPMDTMTHLPAFCEDLDIPYIYVPSQEDIGRAMGVKRNVIVVMVKPFPDYSELYEECLEEVKSLPIPYS